MELNEISKSVPINMPSGEENLRKLTGNDEELIRSLSCSDSLTFREGALIVFKLSFPLIVTAFCNSFADILVYLLAGKLGTDSLGALGLGILTSRMFSNDILFSLASGYDSMGSQSFGKGDHKMVGIYLYRGLLILNLIGIPTYFLLFSSEYLLLFLGVTEKAAFLASGYAKRVILNIIFTNSYLLLNKFLIVQRIVKPQMWISIFSAGLLPFWVYFFAFACKLDFYGIAYAYTLTNLLNLILAIFYIKYSNSCTDTLPPIDKNIWKDWLGFLKIAVPSGCMIMLENGSYMILNIFSGTLSAANLAANQILCNIHSFNFSIPVGIGSAACALVGNSLGNQNINQAKHFAKLSVLLNWSIIGSYIIITLLFRNYIISFYTTNEEVKEIFLISLIFTLFSDTFDTTQGILCRILIGMTKQIYASYVNFVSYFIYMLPIGYVMIFKWGLGIKGIWLALGTSYMGTALAFGYGIVFADWKKVAQDTVDRIEKDRKNIMN